MINVDWTTIKSFITSRSISIQYIELDSIYYLVAIDGAFKLECQLAKNGSEDLLDFEENFKFNGNKKLELKDSDGSNLQRLKVTASGWSLHYHGLQIKTSDLNGVTNKDHNNNDYGFTTIKLYDSEDSLITNGSTLGCVKTVVDWEPTFDYDIIGGDIFMASAPIEDIIVSVVGIPDVPAIYGGSKAFMTGFNLKYVSPLGIHLDGKTPKSTKYDPVNHTNKIRFIFHHAAGTSHSVLVMLNIFKV